MMIIFSAYVKCKYKFVVANNIQPIGTYGNLL